MRVLVRKATILLVSMIGLISCVGQTTPAHESPEALLRDYFFGSSRRVSVRDILDRGREVKPFLFGYATNSEPRIRMESLNLLVKIGGEGYMPVLVRALENDPDYKHGVVEMLFRFCPTNDVQAHWPQLRPLLLKYALETKNPRLNPECAIFLLERFDGIRAIPDLRRINLVALGQEGFHPSESGRTFVLAWFGRSEAYLLALARLGDAEARAEINRLLESPDVYTSVAGLKLAYLADDIFGAKLYTLLDRDDLAILTVDLTCSALRYRVSEYAAEALEHIYGKHGLRPEPAGSIECFVASDGQVLKRFTEKASHEWISRMKAALRDRLAPSKGQP